MTICMFCHIGECDFHCDECGVEVEPGPHGYYPVCCDVCFNRIAQSRVDAS